MIIEKEPVPVSNSSLSSIVDNAVVKKKRYKRGKRQFMNNRKIMGLEYEDRQGNKQPAKVFKPLDTFCCKKKCCDKHSIELQKQIFDEFYSLGDITAQDQVLMDNIQVHDKRRTTVLNTKTPSSTTHDRQISVIYCLQIGGSSINVCKKMFQNIFGCGRGKVDFMIHKKKTSPTGIFSHSLKGKHTPHNLNMDIRNDIAKHIKSFPSYESHYSRKRTSLMYLSPSLNIHKMYDLYKEELSKRGINNIPSYWLYKDIFNETDLKFKMPHVDTCKTCDEYKIMSKQVHGIQLEVLTEKFNFHNNMVDKAYKSKTKDKELLTSSPTTKVIVFDMQQCLPTPDIKTNLVFYKRQLWTYNETIRDVQAKTTYCYMWHEASGGRGSNQIASILYKYIEENVPNNIHHLITYSDTCSGQNRNINVALMFMLAVQNHQSLKIIDQKFLVPGHTHLECDSDHARIERAKKYSDSEISIPKDWFNFVKNVRGKIPLKVIEMQMESFKSFSALLNGLLVKRTMDVANEKINWLKIVWLRYDNNFGIIKFKYSLEEEEPFRCLDLRKGAKRNRHRSNINVNNLVIPQTYSGTVPIDVEKKKRSN